MEDLRFPIGKFYFNSETGGDQRGEIINQMKETPAKLREAVHGLTSEQLHTPYRPEGWTVVQVVHHLPDSHMNSYIRFKLALTEDSPVIKPYDENRWADFRDAKSEPIEVSLALMDSLHHRWTDLLESMDDTDFERKLVHPAIGPLTLNRLAALYAWHGRHHVAHITSLRERMGWN